MFALVKKFGEYYLKNFTPKLVERLHKGYNLDKFKRDCVAGLTVAVISIPLAMALAIASGVTPAQGLYTAIVAGFFIALLGGSRYQIGGPTGAFVVVIFGVMQQYGYDGLAMTMLIAGMVLIIAGYLKLGTYIKYIPYPVVVGFTAGIGLLLISTQVKDLLGLQIDNVPAEILPKWNVYIHNFDKLSWSSVVISVFTFAVIFYTQFKKPKLPAYLISVVGATLIVAVFGLDIATIGNKFGGIPHFLPMPQVPDFDWNLFFKVMPSGLTIAFLAGIESLLSATVVDGMSGDNHNSNAELVGEGIANIACVFFMGVPATGAIARTATNFKARASSPIAGIMQSVFLLLFMLLLSPAAKYIPLACLSAVLIIVGWNMMNVEKIYKLLLGPRGDRYTLLTTLLLTVLVDLNTAISVGFIMASVIFMHRMSREIEIETDEEVLEDVGGGRDLAEVLHKKGVMSLRLSGPLFFGGASQVSRFFKTIQDAPKVLILRMGYVPVVDATGANIIVEFVKKLRKTNTKIIFSNVKKQPRRVLHQAFLEEGINSRTISVASTFENALKMTRRYLKTLNEKQDNR
ncbi:MAG TPA: STAS domain-containing protein [Candidatus Scatocola faecipullorum]|uniref:STAS domain-containing protein n=1 Tax=Candidatus Scatocola faecipullorum TaxID=2840917 RepID=A0A9D1M2S7_9PROT|nr:STAS domain-containing protein [Candidatus Scatocola faecipullorum]